MTIKSAVKDAGKAVMEAITLRPDETKQDLLDTLKQEHNEVKDLLDQLQSASAAGQRRRLVTEIQKALVPHTKAEEKVLYDAIIALRDKEAKVDGHEGYLEHELASKTLQKLASIENATSPEHKAAAKVLKELVEHHIREEESDVWGIAKQHFSTEEREQLNDKYLAAKKRVKTPSSN